MIARDLLHPSREHHATLLEVDYQKWCNGTRDLQGGLGALGGGNLTLSEDGRYVVLPDEVLQEMRDARTIDFDRTLPDQEEGEEGEDEEGEDEEGEAGAKPSGFGADASSSSKGKGGGKAKKTKR